jgi:hypothetical protein
VPTAVAEDQIAEIKRRLVEDTPFYAELALRVVDPREQLVPLRPRPAQLRFDQVLEEQRQAGRPMRAIVLKARKLGFSTWVQAKMMQRATLTANHKALVAAHDSKTSGELFEIARVMYGHLPDDEVLRLKPPIRYSRKSTLLSFGTTSRQFQLTGEIGLNSSILVDTAGEVEAGRGFTYNSLHLSEIAFWPDIKRKLNSLQNTVPDEPGSMIVLESTANGHNHFKHLWDQAVAGKNEYAPIFFPWFEHSDYMRPFASDQERDRFEDSIGVGEYGDGEESLIERFDLTLEQLHWRRWAIENRTQGDLQLFQQEYPADPEEAFLSSGDRVFSTPILMKVMREVKLAEAPKVGVMRAGRTIARKGQHGIVEVPIEPSFIEQRRGDWRLWMPDDDSEEEVKPRQYVIGVDVSGGERSDETADPASHAIEVIDHTTREQVAEYTSRIDEDLLAREIFMLAHWIAHDQRTLPWVGVEITGGWGGPVARILWQDFGYPLVYTRPQHDSRFERSRDRLGWDTTTATKPILEAQAKEILRTEHGIKSGDLVNEMLTYVRLNERGKTGPQPGSHSDRLMAWMIAQQIATEKPLRRIKAEGSSRTRSYHHPYPNQ